MGTNYLQAMNKIISDHVNQMDNTLVYGENLDRGSYISGLSKNLVAGPTRLIKNVGNCEYTHCGVGFGLMMSGKNAVLFVKQLDFMMLGVDHFVSTYALIRATKYQQLLGSFTIVTAIYDQGFQGPQSSFRGLGEICSMSGVSGFFMQELSDAKKIVAEEISKPGIRFFALSQRKANEELTEVNIVDAAPDNSVIQYRRGSEVSIVCMGHSLAHGKSLVNLCDEKGKGASLFSVNYVEDAKWEIAVHDASRTKKLVIIDDTHSTTSLSFRFLTDVLEFDPEVRFTVVRNRAEKSTAVSEERFEVDCKKVFVWMVS
jgi:pyruvate/2-oxoglutarate/acetoin dehydrogenase E1 component